MSQVAYTASSPLFGEDKENYPRFFRLVPVIKQVVDGLVALVKKLQWKRVAIISHQENFYHSVRKERKFNKL